MAVSQIQAGTRDTGWARLGHLSGVVFVVLLVVGSLLAGRFDFVPPPEELKPYFEENSGRIGAAAYVIGLSAFFLIWFAGGLRGSLRAAEGGTARLSTIAFGGGIVASGLVLLTSASMGTAAARAGAGGGISPESAAVLYDLNTVVFGTGVSVALAAMIGPAAVIWLRTAALPRWLGWASAVLAVGLLTPYNWAVLGLFVPWAVVASILLYVRERPPG